MSEPLFLHTSGHLTDFLPLIEFAHDAKTRQALEGMLDPPTREKFLGEFFGSKGNPAKGTTIKNIIISGPSCTVFTKSHFINVCANFSALLSECSKEIERAEQGVGEEQDAERAAIAHRRAELAGIERDFTTWKDAVAPYFVTPPTDKPHQHRGKSTHIRKTAREKMKRRMDPAFEEVHAVLTTFHQKVGEKQYVQAWELLHPDFQMGAWKGEVERFIQGYVKSHAVRNIHVFQIAYDSPSKIDCKIYYEQEFSVSYSSGLMGLQSATVAEADKIPDIISLLHRQISEIGGEGFENIQVYRLFESIASEYIWHKCHISRRNS